MNNNIVGKKTLLATTVLAATLTAVTSVHVMAKTVTVPATATVNNAITLTNNSELDFGTIRASIDSTAVATMTIPANGGAITTDAAGVANIQPLEDGVPATFTVADIPAWTNLTLTVPADGVAKLSSPASGSAEFVMQAFTAYASTTDTEIAIVDEIGTISMGDNTSVDFSIGATLSTVSGATGTYTDAVYNGTFEVTVDY